MQNILIIGGVAAGATAAARARRLNQDATITLLEAGPDVSFANCGLPYYIGGDIEHRSSLILASAQTFYDQYRVNVHTNTEAIRIDRKGKYVLARDNQDHSEKQFAYDKLILAQGGKPLVPQLPGVEKDHVFQLWTLDDMDGIDSFIESNTPKSAVVVGGGFIGLEMVEALAKRGMKVRLVEMAPQVMPNMEGEFAGYLQKELLDYGVELHLGTSLKEIEDNRVLLSSGESVDAEFVLLSVGVRPSLKLAENAGLELGDAGGLLVNNRLQTSDKDIFATGDMLEIENRILGKKLRLPLAGPANRQGRIAAENALGGQKEYSGATGTSVFKLFGLNAGSTGLSLKAAREAGFAAEAVVVHKASHTAYYPGSEKVSLMLIFDRESGKVLGAQAAGRVGIDKRLDVIATAMAGGLTLADLEELDLAYAPPFNSPNGPINMAAFTAENHRSGFSPSILAQNLEQFVLEHQTVAVDLRDPISFGRANLAGSNNLSQNHLRENMEQIPKDQTILLISDDGQKGHVALRMLMGAGFTRVVNLSGGYISLERHARALGFEQLQVGLLPLEQKSIDDLEEAGAGEANTAAGAAGAGAGVSAAEDASPELSGAEEKAAEKGELIVDVRTPREFAMGAHPKAINVPLDELSKRVGDFGSKDREITLYCTSGARSAYGQRILQQMGFSNVRNGGSLHDIMAHAH
ncbi:MAG: FAD-dependent oxidoreductase [Spirochaetia bacterium]|nr:FAD-dependent oxidoreductase [Spirochaetia bacterium]